MLSSLASLPWDLWLILLMLAVVVPWRGAVRVRDLLARPDLHSAERLSLYASTIAFQWLGTGIATWRAVASGFDASDLGLLPARPALGLAIGGVMAAGLALLQIASLRQISRIPADKRGHLYEIARRLMPRNLIESLAFVALVGTVSLCEELLYRGFAFAVFHELAGGSAAIAIVASSALFAIGHLYQGQRGVASTFVLGLVLAGARSWSGSLLPTILAHLAVDLSAGLAGKHFAQEAERALERASPPAI
jgi:membrane protease YdiL (CAAX protease family)